MNDVTRILSQIDSGDSKAAGLVVKFDTSGSVVWAKQFGGEASASGVAIQTNPLNNLVDVYVLGGFMGTVDFDPGPNTTTLTSLGSQDVFVVKLDGAGNFAWARRGGSTGWDASAGIAMGMGADGIAYAYVTGNFGGNAQFGTTSNIVSSGNADGFVAKLSSSGTWTWAKRMGGAGLDWGSDVSVSNSSVYVTGAFWTASEGASFGSDLLFGAGGQEAFISKLDSASGNFIRTKQFGGLGSQQARDVAIGPDEDIYVTGRFQETVDFDPGVGEYKLTAPPITAGNGSVTNAFVTKLDANGDFGGWATQLGEPSGGSSIGYSIAWDTFSASLFVTGQFSGTMNIASRDKVSGSTLTSNNGSSDMFVAKLNPTTGLPPVPPSALRAAALAPLDVPDSLSPSQVALVYDEALTRWQTAGADVSSLRSADIRIANLGGTLLGLASNNTITLDDNASGWGWFIDSTPGDDSEFRGADNQGEMHRMDLLSVLMHEIGHLLGHDHDDEGVMAETLAAGIRRIEAEQVDIATTDLAFGQSLDFEDEFPFAKAKRRK